MRQQRIDEIQALFREHFFEVQPLLRYHGFNPWYAEMGWPEDQEWWDQHETDLNQLYWDAMRKLRRAHYA